MKSQSIICFCNISIQKWVILFGCCWVLNSVAQVWLTMMITIVKVITNTLTLCSLSVFSWLELNLQRIPILYHGLCQLVISQEKTVFVASSIYMAYDCSNTDSISFVVIIIKTTCILCVPLFFFSAVPITKHGASGPS